MVCYQTKKQILNWTELLVTIIRVIVTHLSTRWHYNCPSNQVPLGNVLIDRRN